MKRLILIFLAALLIAGCSNDNKVIIRGTLSDTTEGFAILEKSEVDHNTVIDSAVIKRGQFKFALEITGPEFLQVRFENGEFIGLLTMPGENIDLSFGNSPLAMNYTVTGSPGSEEVRMLDLQLLKTNSRLDSIREIYSGLSDEEIASRGAGLEEAYVDIVDAQRDFNIKFVIENISSMASIKALYQRIDENTYVLYQPRDLQYLKIVSDSLSVKYPVSRHVRALKENVTSELNRMYIDRMASLASQLPETNTKPALPDTKGNMVSVASLKGKYVLVSFWTTTSPECIAELPLLRSLYKEYHAKGLEIFHVSLDRNEEMWRNRVRFEEIPWISVREEDPLNPVYARLMNVQSVPSNILYDREGNIVNTNLTGRNLQIRLDQIFNKQ